MGQDRKGVRSERYQDFLAVGALLLVCVWVLFPLLLHARDHIVDTKYYGVIWAWIEADLWLSMWILSWVVHILPVDPLGLFAANIFHPDALPLARAEHELGMQVTFAPVYLLTGNAILGLQVTTFASFAIAAVAMYALLRHFRCQPWVAACAALLWSFLPWRMDDGLGRVHLLQYQYLPLVVLFLDRYLRDARWGSLVAYTGCLLVQSLTAYYHAYFAWYCVGVVVVVRLLSRRFCDRSLAPAFACTTLVATLMVLVSAPYLHLASAEEIHPNSIPTANLYWYFDGKYFPPFLAVVAGFGCLAAVASLLLRRSILVHGLAAWMFLLITIPAMGLSFGDGLINRMRFGTDGAGMIMGWGTNLYNLACAIVPGFENLREPYRFLMLASFGITGVAATLISGLAGILTRRSRWVGAVVASVSVVVVVVYVSRFSIPLKDVSWALDPPPVYRWLQENGEGLPLLELPMLEYTQSELTNARYMYFSTLHWLPLINGYTGHIPPEYGKVVALSERLPDPGALAELYARTGVVWIVDHRQRGAEELREWAATPGLRRVPAPGSTVVWRLESGPEEEANGDLPGAQGQG